MRIVVLAIIAATLGSAAGLGLTWTEMAGVQQHLGLQYGTTPATEVEKEIVPRITFINGMEHDFGTLPYDQTGKHTFLIRNDGAARLELTRKSISCGKCIQTDFEEDSIEPGETLELEVNYATRKTGTEFYEFMDISTNDMYKPYVTLVIRGYITAAVRPSVGALTLGSISANEQTTAEFRIYGYESDMLEVAETECANPDYSNFFDVETRLLDPSEHTDEPRASVAQLVTLVVKPGLPLGPLNQTIRFKVQAEEEVTIEVAIRGTVVSDIEITGQGFRRDASSINLGSLARSKGATVNLQIIVKGKHRDQTQLKVARVDPQGALQASIGELRKMANGTIHMYPLKIEIVKDAPAVNRLGTAQGKAGKITIETTHPQAKQVVLFVRFATE